jgi:hypothetical protein
MAEKQGEANFEGPNFDEANFDGPAFNSEAGDSKESPEFFEGFEEREPSEQGDES